MDPAEYVVAWSRRCQGGDGMPAAAHGHPRPSTAVHGHPRPPTAADGRPRPHTITPNLRSDRSDDGPHPTKRNVLDVFWDPKSSTNLAFCWMGTVITSVRPQVWGSRDRSPSRASEGDQVPEPLQDPGMLSESSKTPNSPASESPEEDRFP